MSDMTLATTTATTNQYDYMVNINPSIVQKNDSPTMNTSPPVSYDESAQQYAYHDYAFQPMPLSYPTVYPMTYYDPQQQQQQQQQQQRLISSTTTQLHPNSPDSISSSSSPPTPPSTLSTMHRSNTVPIMNNSNNSNNNGQILTTTTSQIMDPMSSPSPMMNPLMTTSTSTSSSSSNSSNSSTSTFSNATTARVKETIARANSVPMEFYHTEFLEYSKETYERKMDAKRNKRKRSSPMKASNDTNEDEKEDGMNQQQKKKKRDNSNMDQNDSLSFDNKNDSDEDDFDEDDDKMENRELSSAELRRQIHIQSEQKRRAQIKDGFDELRKYLPGCNNKKMSKAALLTRTVQQIQHMKKVQTELLSEVERLVQENDNLKKFQHNILQRQAMEKMYSF